MAAPLCQRIFAREIISAKTADDYLLEHPIVEILTERTQQPVHIESIKHGHHNNIELKVGALTVADIQYTIKGLFFKRELYIVNIFIAEEYRGLGVSGYFLAVALKNHSQIKTITSDLMSDNFEVYSLAVKDGLSQEDALKSTPAYRIRQRFGFDKIKSFTVSNQAVSKFTSSR